LRKYGLTFQLKKIIFGMKMNTKDKNLKLKVSKEAFFLLNFIEI
jgi:hypothetical protein